MWEVENMPKTINEMKNALSDNVDSLDRLKDISHDPARNDGTLFSQLDGLDYDQRKNILQEILNLTKCRVQIEHLYLDILCDVIYSVLK